MESWEKRFVDITKYLAVECALVFIGEDAKKALTEVRWPKDYVHNAPPRKTPEGRELSETTKLYLFGNADASLESRRVNFDLTALDIQKTGFAEDFAEWTFRRKNVRIVCMRASEGFTWGFGRPHQFKPQFRPNPNLAGPLVDYRPGTKEGWEFEAVFMKAKSTALGSPEEYLKLYPQWGNDFVTIVVELNPSDVPEKLQSYEFAERKPHEKFDDAFFRKIKRG